MIQAGAQPAKRLLLTDLLPFATMKRYAFDIHRREGIAMGTIKEREVRAPIDPKKIAKALNISPENLLAEGTLAYLHKELRLVEEDLADLRERYGLLSPQELEKKIRDALIPAHPAWEDLIEWENLEAYKQKLNDLLAELHARL